ncbi:hypothetical protein [Amycolatopsis sp. cmx-4-68]
MNDEQAYIARGLERLETYVELMDSAVYPPPQDHEPPDARDEET